MQRLWESGLNLRVTVYWLCDLGQITQLFSMSVFSAVKWGQFTFLASCDDETGLFSYGT